MPSSKENGVVYTQCRSVSRYVLSTFDEVREIPDSNSLSFGLVSLEGLQRTLMVIEGYLIQHYPNHSLLHIYYIMKNNVNTEWLFYPLLIGLKLRSWCHSNLAILGLAQLHDVN